MEILWLAIVFYSLGLAAVLYWRPRAMFHSNGTWKEFGYQRDSRHTMFPFWLFAIAWAFVSYAGAAAISWTVAPAAVAAAVTASNSSIHFTEDDIDSLPSFGSFAPDEMEATPVSRTAPTSSARRRTATPAPPPTTEKLRPGYYVLDESSPEAASGTGLKRYIYYGTNRP
jgi:hypothetical protein